MKLVHGRLSAVATAGIALALSVSCSSGKAPLTAGGAAPKSAAPAAQRVLNVYSGASGQFTQNFNPIGVGITPLNGTYGVIYEPLMFFNQARADDVQPLLATGYEFGDNGRSLTFAIRQGVTWHDGQPFTTDDVVFNFTYRQTNKDLNTAQPFSLVTSVAKLDDTHVKVTFSEPVYTWLWQIAGQTWMVPKHIWEKITSPNKETNPAPVGTGPFMFGTFTAQSYTFKKNPHYWEPDKPKIAGLRYFSYNTGDAAVSALAAGQLDWSGLFIPDPQAQYVSKDPDHNKFLNESFLYVTNLIPNLTKAPLDDLAVRQAVNVALDREKIIKLAFAGLGTMPSPLELALPVYKDYVSPKYATAALDYNPDQARQILESAGYAKGADGYYEKDGKRLSITCHVITGWNDYISTMQIVKQELKDVGIEFKTKEVSYNAFINIQQKGDFEMVIWNGWGGPSPYFMYNNILNSESIPPNNQNMARWRNTQVDAALKAIAAIPPENVDAIKQEIFKIQDQLMAELPYIPVQQSSSLAEFRTVNATGWPTEDNPYALALPFSIPDNGIIAKNLVPTP
ncbi:ABC transporter substrate-binding protein [Streptosporangiaceae bacterium NEAU-GS5]|nr:ABC transporter substrate-binding protein [Streptosporangiaceae bacterium NEAU-GS5]